MAHLFDFDAKEANEDDFDTSWKSGNDPSTDAKNAFLQFSNMPKTLILPPGAKIYHWNDKFACETMLFVDEDTCVLGNSSGKSKRVGTIGHISKHPDDFNSLVVFYTTATRDGSTKKHVLQPHIVAARMFDRLKCALAVPEKRILTNSKIDIKPEMSNDSPMYLPTREDLLQSENFATWSTLIRGDWHVINTDKLINQQLHSWVYEFQQEIISQDKMIRSTDIGNDNSKARTLKRSHEESV